MALSVLWVGPSSATFQACAAGVPPPVQVTRLESAEEALHALAGDPRAVVVLPAADEAGLRRLHQRVPHVPLVAVGSAEGVVAALGAGADVGLAEPVAPGMLVAQVLALARGSGEPLPPEAVELSSQALVGQLARGLAHELNNPVSFLLSNLRTLRGYREDIAAAVGDPPPEPLAEVLEDLGPLVEESLQGAERIQALVQVLREFGRVESGDAEAVDLHEALEAALALAHPELKHRVRLERHFGSTRRVLGWPARVRQLLAHLVLAAVRSLRPAGEVDLRVTTSSQGEVVEVRVESQSGFDAGVLARVWGPSLEGRPVSEDPALHLAAAARIARHHGGAVTWSPEGLRLQLPADAPKQRPAPAG